MKAVLALTVTAVLWAGAANVPRAPEPADYLEVDPAEAELGQLLFYDRILSGNRNIACSTCHHPRFGTSDGVSLSLGEGGVGLGPERTPDPDDMPEQRIPRNAQALFNLGAREFTVMFNDGRVEADATHKSGMRTPLEDDMLVGFDGVLSAQAMFPVTSPDEMAGHYGENDVAKAVRTGRITGEGGAWDIIAKRVADIDAYRERFEAVYPHIRDGAQINFTDVSNALAAFIAFEWRSDDSRFDRFLKGKEEFSAEELEGMALFYGRADCASCHSGKFQTDHGFHAMGVPQLGPGKAARFESHTRDTGRQRVTGAETDMFSFRTPSLRNVTATAPYGHTGAYRDLRAFVAAHLSPDTAISTYDRHQAVLPKLEVEDWTVLEDDSEMAAIVAAADKRHVALNDGEVAALVAFLGTLTDETALSGRLGVPQSVPSGLPVDR